MAAVGGLPVRGASWRPGRWAERSASVLLALALLAAVAVAAGAAAGYRSQLVLTGSMRPALEPGDLLVVRSARAAEIRPGQVISFAAPERPGVVMTHRVTSVRPGRDGQLAVHTRGDANPVGERWTIARDGTVGVMIARAPQAGRFTGWTGDPSVRLGVFAVIGLGLLVAGLRWAWRL
jgi:signal peptidase I